MKNLILSSLIIASAMLTGCNKGGDSSNARIKKVASVRGASDYTYTADNKIQSIKNADGSKTTYTYKDKTISQFRADSTRGMFITSTIFLGAGSYADSSVTSDPSGTYVEVYSHDADGHITQTKDIVSGKLYSATQSVFKDGNEVSRVITDSSNNPRVSIYFEYFTDKSNNTGYNNMGMKFLGNDSKNLMKRFAQVLPSGDTVRKMNFTYHYDDKGRVSQKVIYDSHGTMADSTTVTYF